MLARALRIFLVVEMTIYLMVARWGFDASPVAVAASVVFGLLGLRALLIVLTYLCAWAWRSPAESVPIWRLLTMVIGEYLVTMLTFVLVFPFERRWMPPDRLEPPSGDLHLCTRRPPVVLIHGYTCSRAVWWWMSRQLRNAGWQVATISLEPVFADIEDYVEPLAERIASVVAACAAERVLLVGHSMGGLVARAYLRRYGVAQAAGLVTLGTPHQGSRLGYLGAGENARQMRPGSAWLRELGRTLPGVETLVIYSPQDNFVIPQSGLGLPGARDCAIVGLGHLAMLYSPRVARRLLADLERIAASGGRHTGSRP